MRLLNYLRLVNFRSIGEAVLGQLEDFNVLIGPNDCGKTSILRALRKLGNMDLNESPPKLNEEAAGTRQRWLSALEQAETGHPYVHVDDVEMKHGSSTTVVEVGLYPEAASALLHAATGKDMRELATRFIRRHRPERVPDLPVFKEDIDRLLADMQRDGFYQTAFTKTSPSAVPGADTFSVFSLAGVTNSLKGRLLLCEDTRLRDYGNASIGDYVFGKHLNTRQYVQLLGWLKTIVDSNIDEYAATEKRIVMASGYRSTMEELGSGARSLVCLMTDILGAKEGSVVLIDEPELGLNPLAKQLLVSFLLQQADKNQVFISTHDPTFTNPALWKDPRHSPKVALFLFEQIEGKFVGANTAESKDTAGSFAGYLPHTTSPRDFHLFVEGRWDAQAFRCLLDSQLWNRNVWRQVEDRVEVFHMGGEFWCKLLSSMPVEPYRRLVVLDGDKAKAIFDGVVSPSTSVLSRIYASKSNRFAFFRGSDAWTEKEITEVGKRDYGRMYDLLRAPGEATVIYTLSKSKLDEYFPGEPPGKENIPTRAHRMTPEDVHPELRMLMRLVPLALAEEKWVDTARELGVPVVAAET